MRRHRSWLRPFALLSFPIGCLLGCGGGGGTRGGGTFVGGGELPVDPEPGGGVIPGADNADLSSLAVDPGALVPSFDPSVTLYAVTLTMTESSIRVAAWPAASGATLLVNGVPTTSPFPSAPIAMAGGTTTLVVQVVAASGRSKVYVVQVTRKGLAGEEAYVKASNTGTGDCFGGGAGTAWSDAWGRAVAISGNTLVVGARFESSGASGVDPGDDAEADDSLPRAGAVYVFTRTGTTWTQQAYLKPPTAAEDERFGYSVAVDGDTIVVGATGEASGAGAAFVFVRSAGTWLQQAVLKASNADAGDLFGSSVAVFDDTIVVGAPHEGGASRGVNPGSAAEASNAAPTAGAAYVFLRTGVDWSQQAYLKASNADAGDNFSAAVSIAGDTIAVGAPREASRSTGVLIPGQSGKDDNSGPAVGAVYVFERSGVDWAEDAYVKPRTSTNTSTNFGLSVAISGDTLAVGAPTESSAATGVNGGTLAELDTSAATAGAAFVFVRIDAKPGEATWVQQAYVKASNSGAGDYFGFAVRIDGDVLAVGAPYEAGFATGLAASAAAQASDAYPQAGAAYVFLRAATTWRQAQYVKASNTDAYDWFGSCVAVSNDTVVVSAPFEAGNGVGVNSGAGADDSVPAAGAVYVFR